jgi:uncharacterized protein (DUF952 family)
MLIYHVVLPEEWRSLETELYRAASLESEGFIHCSFSDQLDAVIGRYYGDKDQVLVLEIDTNALMSRVVNEASTNNEIYPHIYGPINRSSVVRVESRRVR